MDREEREENPLRKTAETGERRIDKRKPTQQIARTYAQTNRKPRKNIANKDRKMKHRKETEKEEEEEKGT